MKGSGYREWIAFLVISLFHAGMQSAAADDLDDLIVQRMREQQISGLSLAIVDQGRVVRSQGFGYTDGSRRVEVTASTLFQAGSISKPVTALAALRLAEAGSLSLDADVNSVLRSWKMPENEFTVSQKVTLRRILSHSAGITVHGFPGYAKGTPVPTLAQVLNGVKPANTAPIRVASVPGSRAQYSGGGYVVLQQMMIDATGKPFPEIMRELVLQPAHMADSTFEQPLPAAMESLAATGHYPGGQRVPGRWHLYPEMSAAGLWTTPSDLALFLIVVQQAFTGEANPVISRRMAEEMLTPQKGVCGLGFFLRGEGSHLRFAHDGRDDGFDASMVACAAGGQGAVVMINANDDTGVCADIVAAIARIYHWP